MAHANQRFQRQPLPGRGHHWICCALPWQKSGAKARRLDSHATSVRGSKGVGWRERERDRERERERARARTRESESVRRETTRHAVARARPEPAPAPAPTLDFAHRAGASGSNSHRCGAVCSGQCLNFDFHLCGFCGVYVCRRKPDGVAGRKAGRKATPIVNTHDGNGAVRQIPTDVARGVQSMREEVGVGCTRPGRPPCPPRETRSTAARASLTDLAS